jgi:hypothetical protein
VTRRARKPGKPRAPRPTPRRDAHKGATDKKVGDRTGPGAGYDLEPEQVKDRGGVAES